MRDPSSEAFEMQSVEWRRDDPRLRWGVSAAPMVNGARLEATRGWSALERRGKVEPA